MRKKIGRAVIGFAALLAVGCNATQEKVHEEKCFGKSDLTEISVVSFPAGARVTIEDTQTKESWGIGTTPVRPILVKYISGMYRYRVGEENVFVEPIVGKLKVTVEKEGYKPFTKLVEVRELYESRIISADLERMEPAAESRTIR